MPVGKETIDKVAAVLDPVVGRTSKEIRGLVAIAPRALRYALKALVDAGRARKPPYQTQDEHGRWVQHTDPVYFAKPADRIVVDESGVPVDREKVVAWFKEALPERITE